MNNLLHHVLFVCVLSGVSGVSSPASYRVVVLDCSGSMNGTETTGSDTTRRIDIAIAEVRQLARQLPPSPANPFGLVLFSDDARSHEFTDLASLEAALDRITPGGGTAISPGLKEAHTLLQRAHQSSAMFVLLYTDGENGESDGKRLVAAQQAALDKLFASRNQRGLATNVICRRWANANNDWINALKQKPHWGVVDAKDFGLKSVTAVPLLDVVSARWLDDRNLEVTLQGYGDVGGAKDDIGPLNVRSVNCKLQGKELVSLSIDKKQPTTFLVTAQAADLVTDAGHGELTFEVQIPRPRVVGDQVVLSTVAPHVTVAFKLPPHERTASLRGELKPAASRWTTPGHRRVTTEVEVVLDVQTTSGPPGAWATGIDFLIVPLEEARLVRGSPILRVMGDGQVTGQITLARELPAGLSEGELRIQLIPQNAPDYVTLLPPIVALQTTFSRPPPANTEVAVKAGPPVRGRWLDVGLELAVFEFPMNVIVRGPTTDSAFTIVTPPNVFSIDCKPSKLHSGEQTVVVRLEARCDAGVSTTIQLDIVPPAATDVVQYTIDQPLDVQIIGPPAVQLVLADGNQLANGLRIEIPDTMDTYEDSLTIALLGVDSGVTASRIKAKLTSNANLPFTIGSSPRIGEAVSYSFRVPADHRQNFWLDSRYEVELGVEPDRPVRSIIGSKALLQLVVPAPFKRWLFGLLVVLGAVVLVIGPFFALRRVQRDDDTTSGD